jgi:hypothetical protein
VRCVFAVVTERQPACAPVLVISLCRMVCDIAAALRRYVPHGGGLLGVVWSGFLVSPLAWGHVLLSTTCVRKGCLSRQFSLCSVVFVSAELFDRVDGSIQPVKLSSAVTRVDVPIQPGDNYFSFILFSIPTTSQGCSLVFFSSISMKLALSCAVL